MADFACLDPVYADDIAGWTKVAGGNIATFYFRWSLVSPGTFEKVPVLHLIRPRSAFGKCGAGCNFLKMLDASHGPDDALLLAGGSKH